VQPLTPQQQAQKQQQQQAQDAQFAGLFSNLLNDKYAIIFPTFVLVLLARDFGNQ
jgi:threonine/homoserine/homoserine lactone efflux protein